MKISLLSAGGIAAAAAVAAVQGDVGANRHALVFQPQLNADCHALKTEDKCLAAHCYWCKSAAVPSACYSEDEADQLPPAVFQCDKQARADISWELKKVVCLYAFD